MRSKNRPCPSCGGTGQIGYFQGVSRFLLSWEECPYCGGTGHVAGEEAPGLENEGGKKQDPDPDRDA